MAVPALCQSQPNQAPDLLLSSAASASLGLPTWQRGTGSWGREITGRGPIVANSPDYRTEFPVVGGLGHVSSSAGTQLSAALQAAADSLGCAWLQHALPDTSAGTEQEHKWYKSHRSIQAELTGPEMDKTKEKPSPQSCALGLLLPYDPRRPQSQISEQRQVTSCDTGCVLHIPQQPRGTALVPRAAACSDFCASGHQGASQLFLYGKFWLGCTKTKVKNVILRTYLIRNESYRHTGLEGKKKSLISVAEKY